MDASALLGRAADLIEGVAAAMALPDVVIAVGLFLAVCTVFVSVGTHRK